MSSPPFAASPPALSLGCMGRPLKKTQRVWEPRQLLLGPKKGAGASATDAVQPRLR